MAEDDNTQNDDTKEDVEKKEKKKVEPRSYRIMKQVSVDLTEDPAEVVQQLRAQLGDGENLADALDGYGVIGKAMALNAKAALTQLAKARTLNGDFCAAADKSISYHSVTVENNPKVKIS